MYLDGTVGLGGHASAILSHLSRNGILVGIDRDGEALERCKTFLSTSSPCHLFHDSYHNFPNHLQSIGAREVDGMLLDLGLSSDQLESPERGFSYSRNGPLDMRFNRQDTLTAEDIINGYDEDQIKDLIWRFGEERQASRIARAIVQKRKIKPISTTIELRNIVSSVLPGSRVTKSLSRVFQALRISVNRELEFLQAFLDSFLSYLKASGRIVIISYHSLEDRRVKEKFRELAQGCVCPPEVPVCQCGRKSVIKILTRRPLRPTEQEIEQNVRARSAKLRAAGRIE